jgi:hypothetical protein
MMATADRFIRNPLADRHGMARTRREIGAGDTEDAAAGRLAA